ncbi:MAG: hypothetical protein JKX72_05515 [Robiginitomaculum sp.]|nr:hypothetical protein [Robiginitomaculum sp.]
MGQYNEGYPARLFPTTKIAEDRATSIFLACLSSVYELRKVLMSTVDVTVSKRGGIFQTRLHPRFGQKKTGEYDVPDGIIQYKNRNSEWRALIEVKIETNLLDQGQLERYLEHVSENQCDALITISNEMCARPNVPPLRLKTTSKKLKRLKHYHWSWRFIKNIGQNLLQSDKIDTESERYILQNLIEFLGDSASGIQGFTKMNKYWDNLVVNIRNDLTPTQEEYESAVNDWHQETSELALIINQVLKRNVAEKIKKEYILSPEQRSFEAIKGLKEACDLKASFDIDGLKYPLEVLIDIDKRQYQMAIKFIPSKQVKTPYVQVEHFLKRFNNEGAHSNVTVHVKWPRRQDLTGVTLFDAISSVTSGDGLANSALIDTDKTSIQYIELKFTKTPGTNTFKHPTKIIANLESDLRTFSTQYVGL